VPGARGVAGGGSREFYKWRDGDASPRHARRAQLSEAIKALFAAHHGKFGSPRITDDLREAGWVVSEKTVAAIMREQGLVARAKWRRRHTTRQGNGRWRAPDLIGRDFSASKLNHKWSGDGLRSPLMRASCSSTRCWTWVRGESSGSPSTSTTTPSWHTPR
jgi:transposase InsO family protein